jgi:Bacterial PH domain
VRSANQHREAFRLAAPLVLWWVWVAFAAANLADFAIQGAPARLAAVVSAILAAVTGLAYALALRPRVIAEPAGLMIVNPFRDHRVPWTAIQAVDVGDWVQVHYAPGDLAGSDPACGGPAGRRSAVRSSAASKTVLCWALYFSARAKRRDARRVPSRPGGAGRIGRVFDTAGETARMPAEAAYLASLPIAKAIANRLDARAARERARVWQADSAQAGQPGPVTVRWAWAPVTAVLLPVLALLVILLAFA